MSDRVHPSVLYEKLKVSSAAVFGFDLANLSTTQGLLVDFVSLLRLEIDALTAESLSGKTVDMGRLMDAHALLAKLLPATALIPPAIPEELTPGEEARDAAELEKVLASYDEARRREMAGDPDGARREFEHQLAAALAEFGEAKPPAVPLLLANADAPVHQPEPAMPEPAQQPPVPPPKQISAPPPPSPIAPGGRPITDEPWFPYVGSW
jgi:hypothetical protein